VRDLFLSLLRRTGGLEPSGLGLGFTRLCVCVCVCVCVGMSCVVWCCSFCVFVCVTCFSSYLSANPTEASPPPSSSGRGMGSG